eukprot:337170_1
MTTILTTIGYYGQYVSGSAGSLILFILLLHHILQQCNKQSKKSKNKYDQCAGPSFLTCSFALLLAGIFFCLSSLSEVVWTDYIFINKRICYIHFVALLTFYAVFKLILYISLCRRIIDSFGDIYTYSPQFLCLFQIMLVIVLSVILASCFIFIGTSVNRDEKPPCTAAFPDILVIAIISYDFIVCVISLILFLRPLWKLSNLGSNKTVETKFKKLIKKNALLASISIVTSFMTWIFIAFIDGMTVFLQTIDVLVTCIAILLLFQKNEKVFIKLCCFCCYFCNKDLYYEQKIEPLQTQTKELEDLELKNNIVNAGNDTPSV